jgi:hypothetical protein
MPLDTLPLSTKFGVSITGVDLRRRALFKSIRSVNQYGNRVPMPFSTALW